MHGDPAANRNSPIFTQAQRTNKNGGFPGKAAVIMCRTIVDQEAVPPTVIASTLSVG